MDEESIALETLGPLTARAAGVTLSLGVSKPTLLLAVLLVRPGEPVATGALVEEVWPGKGERAGRESVKNAVGQINRLFRQRFGALLVRSQHDGYATVADAASVDHVRFAEVVRASRRDGADPAVVVPSLGEGLGCWRADRAFVGFEDVPSVAAHAEHLARLRTEALHRYFEMGLALGRHRELIDDLAATADQHPFDEGFHHELALALYRCGRQREALDHLVEVRRLLLDELGVEPGAALRQLELRILDQDPVLDAPAGSGSQSLALVQNVSAEDKTADVALGVGHVPPLLQRFLALPLVGRDEIVAAVRAGPPLAVVMGEPGIGKTRVLAEVAQQAAEEGAMVLHGWSDDGVDCAYQPLLEMLRPLSETTAAGVAEVLGDAVAAISRVAPKLARPVGGAPPWRNADVGSHRYRLFDAVWGWLSANAKDGRRVLVVLDDLQWSDVSTFDLLRFVVRRGLPPGVKIVAAGRSIDGARDGDSLPLTPWTAWTGDVVLTGGTVHQLEGLDEAGTVRLVRALGGGSRYSLDWSAGRDVHRLSGGNPLFIRTLVQRGLESLDLERAVAGGLEHVIGARCQVLPVDVVELLRIAAVLGSEVEASLLGEVTDLELDETLDRLDQAASVGALHLLPGTIDRFRFDNDLLRDWLIRRVPAHRRADVHRAAVVALERRVADPASVARHRCSAVPLIDALSAADSARTAIEALTAKGRIEEAASLAEVALRALESVAPESGADRAGDRLLDDLLLLAVRLHDRSGARFRLIDRLGQVINRAVSRNDASLAAKALGNVDLFVGDASGPEVSGLISRVWAFAGALDDNALRVGVLTRYIEDQRYGTAARVDPVALAELDSLAERPGLEPEALASAILSLTSTQVDRPAFAARERLARVRAHEADLSPLTVARLAAADATLVLRQGDTGRAAELRLQADAAMAAGSDPRSVWGSVALEACLRQATGAQGADDVIERALALGDRLGVSEAVPTFAVQLYVSSWLSGTVAALREPLRSVTEAQPQNPGWRAALGISLSEMGDIDDAASELTTALNLLTGQVDIQYPLVSWCMIAELAWRLRHRPEAGRAPDVVVPLLQPLSGEVVVVSAGIAVLGPVDRYLGLLAAVAGNTLAAQDFLDQAALTARRAGLEPWTAVIATNGHELAG